MDISNYFILQIISNKDRGDFMSLGQLIIGWFYYGVLFMGLSILATVMINRIATRYVTAPLIINALGVLGLAVMIYLKQLSAEQLLSSFLFIYMPIVAASAVFNLLKWLINKRVPLRELQKERVSVK